MRKSAWIAPLLGGLLLMLLCACGVPGAETPAPTETPEITPAPVVSPTPTPAPTPAPGTNALVFYVAEDNPVTGLTLEQIRGIYAGELIDWSQVGGVPGPILPYQNVQQTVSRLVMDGRVMGETQAAVPANADYAMDGMNLRDDDPIEGLRPWDRRPGAIGYCLYYDGVPYGCKRLWVDGVEPTEETVRGGTYPLCTYDLADTWATLSYPSTEAPVCTRRYEGWAGELIPADDYGPLLDFPGTVVYNEYGSIGYLYGLMTEEGEEVVDPVYVRVDRPMSGCLLLEKVFPKEDGEPETRCAIAASDGGWCTDFLYGYPPAATGEYQVEKGLLQLQRGDVIVFLDPATGEEKVTYDIAPLRERFKGYVVSLLGGEAAALKEGVSTFLVEKEGQYEDFPAMGVYIWETGEVVSLPREVGYIDSFFDGLAVAWVGGLEEPLYGYIAADGSWAIEPQYREANDFREGKALVRDGNDRWRIIDKTGAVIYTVPEGYEVYEENYSDQYVFQKGERFLIIGPDGKRMKLTDVAKMGGIFSSTLKWQTKDGTWTLYADGKRYTGLPGMPGIVYWPYVVCEEERAYGGAVRRWLVNLETGERQAASEGVLYKDWGTGEIYWRTNYDFYSGDGWVTLKRLNGQMVAQIKKPFYDTFSQYGGFLTVQNGIIETFTEEGFSRYTLDRETIFYWPLK